ncbi:3'(2'),5'-bisphosphate nucleotidase CysQ [Saccharopolyspora sp. HNM0983]|uniref:3'(2'),5-bisphosphonucleoside 3'(2')-phosphohydrolase n=1 Tax=Saccharopolyspora montiporae TaxID=2781240 RepID=A0A929B5X1_9PSEU|nr:3'(2'),5'-bisphosphate nucleotidase CysQ [Saccharopolyspora sp. HNM0983]MBE9372841.1 3'(2'),5'-bisphosphate nucleotidase CysQ [Saccharopolyspora sp. HNM0983]
MTADTALAHHLATETGHLLLGIRRTTPDPARRREQGDRLAQDFLARQLARHRPRDPVLSEEATDDPGRLTSERVWIVDPLDGTREFSEPDRTDWAVHVALCERGEVTAAAVALPALGRTETTGCPPPASAPAGRVRLAVSRTRPPQDIDRIATALDADLVPMGSAGAKAMAVVRGDVHAYAHAGGQYEWDSAAPVAIARAAGMHTSRLDGAPLVYNQPDPWLPDLLICRPELAGAVLGEPEGVA